MGITRRRTRPSDKLASEPALAWRLGPRTQQQANRRAGPGGDLTDEPALAWRRVAPADAVAAGRRDAEHRDDSGIAEEPALAWRPDRPRPDTTRLYERWVGTRPMRKWSAAALAAVASGPFAVLAALWQNSTAGFAFVLVVVVLGPIIEESMKGAGALWLAELRPWLVPTAVVLPIVTVLSGLVFAALENVWFLVILIDAPSAELVRWRWILGPTVHGIGSLIVGIGAARMWRRALTRGRPDFGDALPFLVTAAAVHGAFNLSALLLSVAGAGPDA